MGRVAQRLRTVRGGGGQGGAGAVGAGRASGEGGSKTKDAAKSLVQAFSTNLRRLSRGSKWWRCNHIQPIGNRTYFGTPPSVAVRTLGLSGDGVTARTPGWRDPVGSRFFAINWLEYWVNRLTETVVAEETPGTPVRPGGIRSGARPVRYSWECLGSVSLGTEEGSGWESFALAGQSSRGLDFRPGARGKCVPKSLRWTRNESPEGPVPMEGKF